MTSSSPKQQFDDPFELGPFFFTMIVALIAFIGWRLSHFHLMTPKHGLGYFIGILGGLLMVGLLYYPVQKRKKYDPKSIQLRTWFKVHMLLGVLGPLAILFHCNYRLGDMNSNIALMTMLTVAISGIFGRYFYIRIHRGLYGEKENLDEMQKNLQSENEKISILLKQYPDLLKDLSAFVVEYSKPGGKTITSSLVHALKVSSKVKSMKRKLTARTLAAVRSHGKEQRWSSAQVKLTVKNINLSVKSLLGSVLKIAQFNIFERLFSYWHVLHVPLFFIMLTAIVVHIVAAHLY